MSHYQTTPEGKDPALWELAQKRASFKTHAMSYIIVNLFLWGICFNFLMNNFYGYTLIKGYY